MNKIFTVTKDINANYKKLKALERKGFIKVINIRLENNRGRKNAILPTATLGHTHLSEMQLEVTMSSSQKSVLDKLKQIIGVNNIKDCIHLEAHIRDGYDYFVTEDTDVLDKREQLVKEFPKLQIYTTVELVKLLEK